MFTCGPSFFRQAQAGPSDPYFANVGLLLHFDGASGAIATSDSSSFNRPITRAGSGSLSTSASKFGGSSVFCPGGANGWGVADSSAWAFGNGQFTVEQWVYFTTAPGASETLAFISQWRSSTDISFLFCMSSGALRFNYSTTGTASSGSAGAAWTPALNTWYHIAADRDATNTLRVYVNGAVIASAAATATFRDSSLSLDIGGNIGGGGFPSHIGYTDEVRITKGIARYAGAFTPPTAAFPNS